MTRLAHLSDVHADVHTLRSRRSTGSASIELHPASSCRFALAGLSLTRSYPAPPRGRPERPLRSGTASGGGRGFETRSDLAMILAMALWLP